MPRKYQGNKRDWPHYQEDRPEQNQWYGSWTRRHSERGSERWEDEHPPQCPSPLDELSERYTGLGGRGWYEGWSDAMHRGEGPFAGRGPRNYVRPDNRIEEDVNERLTEHPMIDATDIEVSVQNGEVTLRGQVDHREAKRLAEDIADSVFGVKDVNNQIRVKHRGSEEKRLERAS